MEKTNEEQREIEVLVEKMKDSSQHDLLKSEIKTIYREKSETEKDNFSKLLASAIRLVPFEQTRKILEEMVQDDYMIEEMGKREEIFHALDTMRQT